MSKILITTVPFAEKSICPRNALANAGIEYVINPLARKLKEKELAEMISDFTVVIAGTEPITDFVMEKAKNLRLISRVGVGLDNVDLLAAKRRNIKVCYTPEAPSPAVAELTIGLILSLIRSVHIVNLKMHLGVWDRIHGKRISELTVGIVGVGRIGQRVIKHLDALGAKKILVNDINPDSNQLSGISSVQWVDIDSIYTQADVVSFHVPLTSLTRNMVTRGQLLQMKKDAMIVNTARGGIINEDDLLEVMESGRLSGVALDVFAEEPYNGRLRLLERCLLTSHMGSMSLDCRARMELEATEEAIRFLKNEQLRNCVPESEYQVQREWS